MKTVILMILSLSLLIFGCVGQIETPSDSDSEALRPGPVVIEVPDDSDGFGEEAEEELIVEDETEGEDTDGVTDLENGSEGQATEDEFDDSVILTDPEEDASDGYTTEIIIDGKNGFDPLDSVVREGSTVTFVNPHDFGNVLIFKRHDRPGTDSSSTLAPNGGTWERTFDEAGTYDVWTFAFGVFGTITVE